MAHFLVIQPRNHGFACFGADGMMKKVDKKHPDFQWDDDIRKEKCFFFFGMSENSCTFAPAFETERDLVERAAQ